MFLCSIFCSIWYVSWDDLVILEQEREYQVINPAARLVGGNFIESASVQTYYGRKDGVGGGPSKASIMNSGAMRCNNCPGKGCANCPLYGEFLLSHALYVCVLVARARILRVRICMCLDTCMRASEREGWM